MTSEGWTDQLKAWALSIWVIALGGPRSSSSVEVIETVDTVTARESCLEVRGSVDFLLGQAMNRNCQGRMTGVSVWRRFWCSWSYEALELWPITAAESASKSTPHYHFRTWWLFSTNTKAEYAWTCVNPRPVAAERREISNSSQFFCIGDNSTDVPKEGSLFPLRRLFWPRLARILDKVASSHLVRVYLLQQMTEHWIYWYSKIPCLKNRRPM